MSFSEEKNPSYRFPDSGITILIAGGGVAGLTTALEAFRNGHKVTIVEAKSKTNPAGDFFSLSPSGWKFLKHWPRLKRAFDDAAQHSVYRWSKYTGENLFGPIPGPYQAGVIIIRPLLYKMLVEEVEANGIELICNTKVDDYFEENNQAGVITADGQRLLADVVIAADGVHSRSWRHVVGSKEEPQSTGHSVFRTAMPTSHAFKNELVRSQFGPESHGGKEVVWFFMAPDTHAICTIGKDTTCWALFHSDPGGNASESWSNLMDPDEAMKLVYDQQNWDPGFLALVRQTPPKSVVDWRLMWRNPQSKTVSSEGRVVQVGDAAHSFLPTSANGATQAMEDAVSLSTCLRLAGKDRVKLGLQVHAKLRFERVVCAQKMGLITRENLHKTDWDAVAKNPQILAKNMSGKWISKHDPEDYAIQNFEACANHLVNGTPFSNTNFPEGYVYAPWNIKQLLEDAEKGLRIVEQGDWD